MHVIPDCMGWNWWIWYDLCLDPDWMISYEYWHDIGIMITLCLVGETWF